ncbi:MAG: Gfo/Idh/MocA family oxidoreductase [Cellulosilyticaceae bacterium]
MKQITAIVVGAGLRGALSYAPYALENPGELKIVGVAEPIEARRKKLQELHNIPEENCFESWDQILAIPKFADAALICTQDQMHYEPAMQALELGYHLLLEKPIAPTAKECVDIKNKANEKNLHVVVCHVLRYTTLFKELKELISQNRIGKIMSMTHCENVYHIHHSHSFVRGNWRNSKESNPMILAKSCHDLDVIQWLADDLCTKVSSFGSLKFFCEANAPEDAPAYCLDGCPHSDTCAYDAAKIYVKNKQWGASAFCEDPANPVQVIEDLRHGDYGRCVFRCDNDVVDHQVVNMEYEEGLTVAFSMCAFTQNFSRTMKLMGTYGEIRVLFGDEHIIEIYDFRTGRKDVLYPYQNKSGHGGGDFGIMSDFVKLLATGKKSSALTSIDVSVQSHLLAFAAEKSRLESQTIHMDKFEG